jgi:potassium efflux system protein
LQAVGSIGAVSGITKILTVLLYLGIALFLYRVFHPKSGVLAYRRDANKPAIPSRRRRLSVLVLVGFPLAVIAFGLGGYMYSAGQLLHAYGTSLLLIVGLVVVDALARRWLRVVRRRLAREAELERRQALQEAEVAGEPASAGEESADLEGEFAGVDLDELSEDSRGLLKIAVGFAALAGLYLIWSSVLPAFGILDDVTLWQYMATVDGEEQHLAVTLADLGLALICSWKS